MTVLMTIKLKTKVKWEKSEWVNMFLTLESIRTYKQWYAQGYLDIKLYICICFSEFFSYVSVRAYDIYCVIKYKHV